MPYGDRLGVLIERVAAIQEDLRDHRHETREQLSALTVEVRTTNGRVRKLELWQEGVRAVRAALSWRVPLMVGITSSVVSGIVVGIVLLAIGAST